MKNRQSSVPELLEDDDLIELNVPLGPLRQGFISGYAPAGSTEELEELSPHELLPLHLDDMGSGTHKLPDDGGYKVPRGSVPIEVEAPLPPPPSERYGLPDLTLPPPPADLMGAVPPPLHPRASVRTEPAKPDRRVLWITLILLLAVVLGAALGFYVRGSSEIIRPEPLAPVMEPAPAEPVPAEPEELPTVEDAVEVSAEAPSQEAVEEERVQPAPAPRKRPVARPRPQPRQAADQVAPTAPKPAPVSPPEEPALPESLSRAQVKAGFETARAAVAACAEGRYGVARVSATVTGGGRVTYALVSGDFQGTPAGSCMARAVRKAKFPQFSGEALSVEYPYSLR